MESSLEIGFLRVTEKAAIAAARTMGYGKRKYSDQVAVESMSEELNKLKMRGTIVIGEGERDKAPMLYVGEPLGRGWTEGEIYPEIDIAVDPLEGTNLCATGAANAIAVLAASEKGGLLNAPDVYMDKIVVGPTAAELVGLDKSAGEPQSDRGSISARRQRVDDRGSRSRTPSRSDRADSRSGRAHQVDQRRRP